MSARRSAAAFSASAVGSTFVLRLVKRMMGWLPAEGSVSTLRRTSLTRVAAPTTQKTVRSRRLSTCVHGTKANYFNAVETDWNVLFVETLSDQSISLGKVWIA